jgi:hypothetical protein
MYIYRRAWRSPIQHHRMWWISVQHRVMWWIHPASGDVLDLWCRSTDIRGTVTANIESLYIRNYGLTMTVYSNLRFFQEPYIRIYGFFWSFCEVFSQPIFDITGLELRIPMLLFSLWDSTQVTPLKFAKIIAIFDIRWSRNIEYSNELASYGDFIAIFDIRWSWSPLNSNLWRPVITCKIEYSDKIAIIW